MFFEFPKGHELRTKVSAWTLVIPRSKRRRKMVRNAHLHTWRKMENYCWCHGVKFQRKWRPIFRGISDLNRGFLKRKGGNARFTSLRNLRMQSSYLAQCIQQIIPVSRGQQRVGVKNWLSWYLVKRTWAWENPSRRWTISCLKSWNRKKWILWYRHQGEMNKQRETACVFIDRDLRNCQMRYK